MSDSLSLDEAVEKARETIEKGGAVRFSGRCGVGKTTLCKAILTSYPEFVREGKAFIVAPWNRESADMASYEVLKDVLSTRRGVYSTESRPVKTPDALAFAILEEAQEGVRLLDATTQAKLVAEVLQDHVDYVKNQADRDRDRELEEYLKLSDLSKPGTTYEKFKEVFMASGFITKLRETFARFNELAIDTSADMKNYADYISDANSKKRAQLTWDMVQKLRKEYADKVKAQYPGFYDNSYMLLECRKQIGDGKVAKGCLPKFIVVDDCQDLNLATFYLLKELHLKGVPVIFVGNDDESVQGYKGAFPDVLSILESGKEFECQSYLLESEYGKASETEFLCNVSNNIGSWFTLGPVPKRPGKPSPLPDLAISDYFECKIAENEEEELDFLEHEIMNYMISGKREEEKSWGDLAIIANSNIFLRKVGKRLLKDRIPFRYTTVGDEALKDSQVVKGMLALMQLSYYAAHMSDERILGQMCKDSYTLAEDALKSPLLASKKTNTSDLLMVRNTLQCILSPLASSGKSDGEEYDRTLQLFPEFRRWADLEEKEFEDKNLNSFFAFLLVYPEEREAIFRNLFGDRKEKKGGKLSIHGWMFDQLFELLEAAKQSADDIPELFCKLWEGCGKSHSWDDSNSWQKLALEGGPESDEINLWLDQLIRLQHLADIATDEETVPEFCERVSKAYIESDSLASVAPKNDKITLSSPSGVQSKHYKKVWIADLQEGEWNKSAVDDLFLIHLLEATVTAGEVERIAPDCLPSKGGDSLQSRYAIQDKCSYLRAFLVASTRTCGDPTSKTAFVAVDNDTHTPYQLLNVFQDAQSDTRSKWEKCKIKLSEPELRCNTLKGLADYCRLKLVEAEKDGRESEASDAAYALSFLTSKANVKSADPKCWNFMRKVSVSEGIERDAEIKISPSQVEGIWNDTMRRVLDSSRYSGPTKSVPQARFGTNVHKCAQQITDAYGRHPENLAKEYAENPESLAERLMGSFRELQKEDLELSPLEQSDFQRRAQRAMDNLATYLISVATPSNPEGVEEVFSEQHFEATVTLEDIFKIAKNTDEFSEITFQEFIEALEVLGNFDNLSSIKDTKILLSGTIDRIERRKTGEIFVVDYKTGHNHFNGIGNVSDLQLLCYQLLLYFSHRDGSSQFKEGYVQRSMIFSLEHEVYPATDKDKDKVQPADYGYYFQPCIFDERNGGLNACPMDRCTKSNANPITGHMPKIPDDTTNRVLQILRNQLPEGNSKGDLKSWLPWVFYMLSKFFFAVRYICSDRLQMREIKDGKESDEHLVERAMTIYGMCESKSEEGNE